MESVMAGRRATHILIFRYDMCAYTRCRRVVYDIVSVLLRSGRAECSIGGAHPGAFSAPVSSGKALGPAIGRIALPEDAIGTLTILVLVADAVPCATVPPWAIGLARLCASRVTRPGAFTRFHVFGVRAGAGSPLIVRHGTCVRRLS